MGGLVAYNFLSIFTITTIAVSAAAVVRLCFTKKNNKEKKIWKSIGEVTNLVIYPLKGAGGKYFDKAYCTENGLHDVKNENLKEGCIVIYKKNGESMFSEKNIYLEEMQILYTSTSDGFVLQALELKPIMITFRDLAVNFTMVTIHEGEIIPVRDCGNEAAKWVSQILPNNTNELRLGFYSMDFKNNLTLTASYRTFLENLSLLTSNGMVIHPNFTSPLLISANSIDDVSGAIKISRENRISPLKFNPNILIQCTRGHTLQEYKWEKIKIGNVEFDCAKHCERCLISRNQCLINNNSNFDMPMFLTALKWALLAYIDLKIEDIPFIGIQLKLCGDEGIIQVKDEVYVL